MSTTGPAPGDVDDPVGYFLQDVAYHGKSDRTQEAYERVLRRFEAFLQDPDRSPSGTSTALSAATHRDCMAWVHEIRDGVAESTVATYASYLHRFYAYMTQVGAFESNPMTLVVEEMDETIDTDPARRDIPLSDMRAFVADVTHPLDQAVIVVLLKTGMRVGELCNLDRRDVHLSEIPYDDDDTTTRAQLAERPDSLYVAADPARGAVTNGEQRTASNKRKRATVIPVDDELRQVLGRWLAVRPDAHSPADPLFTSTSRNWGSRLTPDMVHHAVEGYARDRGWYQSGGGAEVNVTPHYFRHFFTTHLRDRTGDRGVVKYLRGDVAQDIIDTYTHNWGDRVRETYESNVYTLL
ncbi:tyrosine-type recombinase/integrase [Halostella pelagica]|uniref:tyrosine-type recombinase/integrase n=1 Tax=Halostella pelagica TaxID=2583824 RepID=UPI001081538F|nr:tyrosine-type recombinase/integrase [Halostella pelagica]